MECKDKETIASLIGIDILNQIYKIKMKKQVKY